MAEYALRYDSVARAPGLHNFAIYAFDQRGHGRAVKSSRNLGIVTKNWFNLQLADMHLLVRALREKHPAKKIFLLGHSMGSFLSQRYFQLHGGELDGLILSATNGKKDPLIGTGILLASLQAKLFGRKYRSKLIDKLSFGRYNAAFKPNRTSHDWLNRNEAEVDKYIIDPFCGFISSAMLFRDLFKGVREAFDDKNIKKIPGHIPVYAFAGDKDQVGYEGKGFMLLIEKWKAAGVKDISYHLYKGGRHEMLNEINRDEVVANMVSWLNKHV